ncbi:MAG: nucleotidyltransferase family protein [Ignavibacteriales bacterium]
MSNWKQILVKPTNTIYQTLELIDKSALQIALVVDEKGCLLGTVTDGDVRRGILNKIGLNSPVVEIMNKSFSYSHVDDAREKVLAVMTNRSLHQVPIIDANGCLVGIHTIDSLMANDVRENVVLLMAGGMGNRLRPLTANCPKPLLKVGGKPILESIIESFIEQGFINFFISINYKGEMIEDYFADGSKLGVNINYIREDQRLGTAGPLKLLPRDINKPIMVMNGDILTKVDFRNLLDFHTNQHVDATLCIREYQLEVPYGVVFAEGNRFRGIKEKPKESFNINAGLYVLNPEIIDFIPTNEYFDMPELFEALAKENRTTAVYQIREYWMDIGHIDDYDRANGEYQRIFK